MKSTTHKSISIQKNKKTNIVKPKDYSLYLESNTLVNT